MGDRANSRWLEPMHYYGKPLTPRALRWAMGEGRRAMSTFDPHPKKRQGSLTTMKATNPGSEPGMRTRIGGCGTCRGRQDRALESVATVGRQMG